MKKIGIIFGTRPEAIKVAPIITELSKYKDKYNPIIIVTAQHREMLDQMLSLFFITPDIDLNLMVKNQTLSEFSARALSKLDQVIDDTFDMLMVHGDTTTTFIGTLIGFYHKIPVAHIEAGLRTYNMYQPFPEEANRRITDLLSSYYFAPTKKAKENLIEEKIPEERIFITGNSVIDALFMAVKNNYVFKDPAFNKLDPRKTILITQHRRENWGKPMEEVARAILKITKLFPEYKIVFSLHKNPKVRERILKILKDNPSIYFTESMDYVEFANLINRVHLIITDSGGIQEEAPSLGKPVLVTREVTERPEALEYGTVKLVGTSYEKIVNEIKKLLTSDRYYSLMANA
ncbi:MAG TPA: UDP-N-acetylglucosamine 2-epimerase (non-hydrolyzing), partial [Candidatus Atribacteria bacterium]|nr:UDP-N-acetylglucosamine 2-epimerase (non-hydrolyzing) [Candidatus Atribacteria bacterium]